MVLTVNGNGNGNGNDGKLSTGFLSSLKVDQNKQLALDKLKAEEFRTMPDPDNVAFRVLTQSAQGSTVFSWYRPGTTYRELSEDVVGLRGYIVKCRSGMFLWSKSTDKDEKGKKKPPVCSTTSAQVQDDVVVSSYPFWYPSVYYANQYNTTNIPDEYLVESKAMGSRGQSCADCVANKQHILEEDQTTSICGIQTQLLFYVTEIGVLQRKLSKNEVNLVWKKAGDFKDETGEQVLGDGFIVNMPISKSVLRKKVVVTKTAEGSIDIPEGGLPLTNFIRQKFIKTDKVVFAEELPISPLWAEKVDLILGERTADFADSIKSIPLFFTSPVTMQELDKELQEVINLYQSTVENYCTANNLPLPSERTAVAMKNITPASTNSEGVAPALSNVEFDLDVFKRND